ncbi:hypothetical protein [Acidithiobacillus ferrivorans]|uniref:hypothetical protein n=1 Tax=Acidithiobacillus ferrivorans TaxID=160808 RepID=UPI0011787DBC|nr:hypothetical protein [Acidithiobacillus ferrivorans]
MIKFVACANQKTKRQKKTTMRHLCITGFIQWFVTWQVSQGMVSRSTIHRLLQRHGLSRPAGATLGDWAGKL